jgi:hypothetical protein
MMLCAPVPPTCGTILSKFFTSGFLTLALHASIEKENKIKILLK